MNWEMIGTFMTVVGIPALGAFWALIERKRSRRDDVQHKFNGLILEHMDKTGCVVMANANIYLKGPSTETMKELEDASAEYESFRKEFKEFKNKQTQDALRVKKGG